MLLNDVWITEFSCVQIIECQNLKSLDYYRVQNDPMLVPQLSRHKEDLHNLLSGEKNKSKISDGYKEPNTGRR